MRRIRLTVSYDGTDFHGWQVQPDRITIQSEMQRVFSEIEGAPVRVDASGRTDAGVHAVAQVAAVTMSNPIPCVNLRKAANRLLPASIRVMDAAEAAPDFHPRFQAVAKTYEYRMFRGETCPPFLRNYVCHWPRLLNEDVMVALAPALEGVHDFTAFAASDDSDGMTKSGFPKSKVRRIFSSNMWQENELLLYRVRGSGFLKHMVRNIAGVLIEAGKGNIDRAALEQRLRTGNAIPAGPTAPPQGLFLLSVEYAADPHPPGGADEPENTCNALE